MVVLESFGYLLFLYSATSLFYGLVMVLSWEVSGVFAVLCLFDGNF